MEQQNIVMEKYKLTNNKIKSIAQQCKRYVKHSNNTMMKKCKIMAG